MRRDEMIIRIDDTGSIYVENIEKGVKSYKRVEPKTFIDCIRGSIRVSGVSSGILPAGTFSFTQMDNGNKRVCMEFPSRYSDVIYEKTEYKDFPLPRLVFGFNIKNEMITGVDLGVVEEGILKPKSKMYKYPFSNVHGFRRCCGGNRLPQIKSLHQLTGVMFYIMSMPNNNDHYTPGNSKLGLQLRDLFEALKYKEPSCYYTDVLYETDKTLQDFVNG